MTQTPKRGKHRADDSDSTVLPPDAAARDAAKRDEAGSHDQALTDDFVFATRGVSDEERAAVIAVLTQVRAEETEQVRRVERREHLPWSRSQRVPQPFGDLLIDG